jgi:type III restriction enzyme
MTVAESLALPEEIRRALRRFFDSESGIERVWLFGSHARGDAGPRSDVDLAVDAPALGEAAFAALAERLEALELVRAVDLVRWQTVEDPAFREAIESERRLFWPAPRPTRDRNPGPGLELKDYQRRTIEQLGTFVDTLAHCHETSVRARTALREAGVSDEVKVEDFSEQAWETLQKDGALPPTFSDRPYTCRTDAAGQPIPNVCLKVPTGGGKTLLAASAVGLVHTRYLRRHTGLVLWIVPNEAIYRQTLAALSDRDHPYRQMLNVAGAGRVKILEKGSPLSAEVVSSHLCVMVLMLASAARKSKETLRFFRDRGSVHGFFPREDDVDGHFELLARIPNLDVYAPLGADPDAARLQKGSIVKDSLGNVMRLVRPMVVIDEQQRAYTENALSTIDGFNPSFVLELSATPRMDKDGRRGANVLVDVRGTDLDAEEMIKLPINVDVRPWADWQACLRASLAQLDALDASARSLEGDTNRYIRPILLIQVERTGSDQRESGLIHAEDAKACLLQLGLREEQIAIKTSDRDDLAQPENQELLSPANPVRAIITRQALQEGWDCPFAYVLCALAAGRNPRALTQLVGRILRQPHAAKTGVAALDECWVFCNDAETGTVVRSIKDSLEAEGMGDLASAFRIEGGSTEAAEVRRIERRPSFERARIFLPQVTWIDGEDRRALDYDSDILAAIDFEALDFDRVARGWTPPGESSLERRFRLDLRVLDEDGIPRATDARSGRTHVDRVHLARAIADLVPNAWIAWRGLDRVLSRLRADGIDEYRIAGATDALVEQIRTDLDAQREALAEGVFRDRLAEGRIEFRLRADRTDYELPSHLDTVMPAKPRRLRREEDDGEVERSLFEPFYEHLLDNDFERDFACYLDSRAALRWWHRNVARAGYGLQGWRRNRVYPDFVFMKTEQDGSDTLVVMETKGAHLGNEDTDYKRAFLAELETAWRDDRLQQAGELELVSGSGDRLLCRLVFDQNWRNTLETEVFADRT